MQSKSSNIHDRIDAYKEEKEGTTKKTPRFVKGVKHDDSLAGHNAYRAAEISPKDAKKTGQSSDQAQNGGRMQDKTLRSSGKSISVPTDRIIKSSSSLEGTHQASASKHPVKSSDDSEKGLEDSGSGHDLSNEQDLLNPRPKKDKVDTAELPGRIRKEEK